VTIVVPVYRNAGTVAALAQRVQTTLGRHRVAFQLLFVVDASPDESWAIVEHLSRADRRIAGLLLAANVGQHAAALAGLAFGIGQRLVVMDGDLQDPPEGIPALVERVWPRDGSVFGRRSGRYESWDRLATSRAFKTLLRLVSDVPSDVGTFFAVSPDVAARMQCVPVRAPQVVVLAHHCSLQRHMVGFERAARRCGRSAYTSTARVRAAARTLLCALDCRRHRGTAGPCVPWTLPPIVNRINV